MNRTPEPKDTTYDSVGRVYNFEDARKAYYSVTTMLSKTADHSWLDKWRERVGNAEADRICRAATNMGERFHKAMEDWYTSGLVYVPETAEEKIIHLAWNSATASLHKLQYEHIQSEIPLWSDALQLAGRCDALGYIEGEPAIIDFKLVKTIKPYDSYEDYRLQCTAYAAMVKERMDITCKRFIVVMASKDGGPTYLISDNPHKYFSKLRERIIQFRHLLEGTTDATPDK